MNKTTYGFTLLGLLCIFATAAHGAFLVEVPNFTFGGDTTSASISVDSAAVGLTPSGSLFGGNGANFADTYIATYTPGTNADNFSPAAGSLLGSTTGFGTETATGAAGGASGNYNVYFTVPASTNVNALGSNITITGDGGSVVLSSVVLNETGTGADLDPGPAFVGGANNSWYKAGTVALTTGTSYTFTMESNANSFVSQRLAGVMWELVPVPEPGCGLLLSLSGLALIATMRRRR